MGVVMITMMMITSQRRRPLRRRFRTDRLWRRCSQLNQPNNRSTTTNRRLLQIQLVVDLLRDCPYSRLVRISAFRVALWMIFLKQRRFESTLQPIDTQSVSTQVRRPDTRLGTNYLIIIIIIIIIIVIVNLLPGCHQSPAQEPIQPP